LWVTSSEFRPATYPRSVLFRAEELPVLPHSIPQGFVVRINPPLHNQATFNLRPNCDWRFPAILCLQLPVRCIGAFGHAKHQRYRSIAEALLDGNRIVRNHPEVGSPSRPHLFAPFDNVCERIHKAVFWRHQCDKRIDILPVDCPHKGLCNGFRRFVHADIVPTECELFARANFPPPNPTNYNGSGTLDIEENHAALRRSYPPYELH